MTNLAVKDANGDIKYMKVASGTGTDADPYVVGHGDSMLLTSIGKPSDAPATFDAYGSLGSANITQMLGAIATLVDQTSVPKRGIVSPIPSSVNTVGTTSTVIFNYLDKGVGLIIQNLSSNNLWINFAGEAIATAPCIKISPNETFQLMGLNVSAISYYQLSFGVTIIGEAANQSFSAMAFNYSIFS